MLKIKRYKQLLIMFFAAIIVLGIYGLYHYVPIIPNQIKIGTTYMTMNNTFYKIVNAEIEKVVDSKGDVLYTRDPALSVDKQCEQIASFMSKGVDIIIINPVDSKSQKINKALQQARHAGTKVVVVDSQLGVAKLADATVVSDNYKAGVLDAENMMATVSKADILLLEHADTLSAVDRINGFLDTIANHPKYRVVCRQESYGQTEIAMPKVEKVIDQGLHFDVVMALNDRSAIGALAAIKEKGLQHKIYIYGVDGSPDMKNLIHNTNDVQATVAQSPVVMGQKTIEVAYALLRGKKYPNLIKLPVTLIDKHNISQYDIVGWQ